MQGELPLGKTPIVSFPKKAKAVVLSHWQYNCLIQAYRIKWRSKRASRQECILWLNFFCLVIVGAETGEINVMQKCMEEGPEVPSLSSRDVLLNKTGLKNQKISQDSAWLT